MEILFQEKRTRITIFIAKVRASFGRWFSLDEVFEMISFSAIPTIAESYIGSTTIVWLYIFRTIRRLNSGNFGIFDHTQSFINLESSVCRAWEIISNDTKISMIPWEPDIKNSFWNFCVGVWVGGQPWTNFSQSSKDAPYHCASFDITFVTEQRRA